MSDFQDLLNLCQIEAIKSTLIPTESYLWRKFCRSYSQAFYTPLHLVEEMDIEYVIKHIMEKRFEDFDVDEGLDKLLELIKRIEDPNYQDGEEKDLSDFLAQAEKEEELRLKEGRKVYDPKSKASKKSLLENKERPTEKKPPTHGTIDLNYLSKLEGEES